MHSKDKFNQWFNYSEFYVELSAIWSYIACKLSLLKI